jgi:hypothetical protein
MALQMFAPLTPDWVNAAQAVVERRQAQSRLTSASDWLG